MSFQSKIHSKWFLTNQTTGELFHFFMNWPEMSLQITALSNWLVGNCEIDFFNLERLTVDGILSSILITVGSETVFVIRKSEFLQQMLKQVWVKKLDETVLFKLMHTDLWEKLST